MYDVGQLLPLFSSILGDSKQYSNYEYYFYCPFCHHHNPKLAINLGKGKWHCWKCGSAGNRLISLFKKLDVSTSQIKELQKILHEEYQIIKRSGEEVKADLYLPTDAKPLWKHHFDFEYKHAMTYLLNRGITKEDILKYNFHYCTDGVYQNRILIPNYDETGKLNFFTGRDFFDVTPLKYKNPPISKNIIGFDYYVNWKYRLNICEGVFDAVAIKRNAIPLFGKTLSKKLFNRIIEKKVEEICLILDKDALVQVVDHAEKFMSEGITVFWISLSAKDPSEMGFQKLSPLLQHPEKLNFSKLIELKASLTGCS